MKIWHGSWFNLIVGALVVLGIIVIFYLIGLFASKNNKGKIRDKEYREETPREQTPRPKSDERYSSSDSSDKDHDNDHDEVF